MSSYLPCREFAEFISFGGGLYLSLGIAIRTPEIGLLRTYALLRIELFPFQRLPFLSLLTHAPWVKLIAEHQIALAQKNDCNL